MIAGVAYHRSIITHSPILMTPLFIYYLLIPVPRQIYILLGFTFIGYASHLLLDNVPAKFDPIKVFVTAINPKEAPSTVNHIPSQFEELWLIISASLLTLYAYIFFTIS